MSSEKKKQGKERSEEEKKKKNMWEEIHILRVVEVKSLNLVLDLLCKDPRMKPREIIEDYKTLLF